MPNHVIKHQVVLTVEQRADLERMTRQSSIGVAKKRWATIHLLADEAHPDGRRTDEQIAAEVQISVHQLERIRKKFARDGLGGPPSSVRPTPMPACPRFSMDRQRLTW